ncbi:hypothetical protein AKJ16_DCAP21341 [Drosera capensis]
MYDPVYTMKQYIVGIFGALRSLEQSIMTRVNRHGKRIDSSFLRRTSKLRRPIRAHAKCLGSGSDQVGDNEKSGYHPLEDILISDDTGAEERQLTAAETCRTMVEVNSKATLMFSGMADNGVHHNLFLPDLPYLTDEHGNIYFQVNVEDDIMQSLTSRDNYVQVMLGVETKDMFLDDDNLADAALEFDFEGIDDDDGDFDEEDEDSDDDDEIAGLGGEWVQIDDDDDVLDDEDDDDDDDEEDSNGSLGDWAQLETMRSSHPMHFAKKIAQAQVELANPIDYMKQPRNGLSIEGLIRPALIEEQSGIQMQRSHHETDESEDAYKDENPEEEVSDPIQVNGHANESLNSGKKFYKLEMTKIDFIFPIGYQKDVEVEAYRNARPDAIAHSASKIISRVNAAGEKTTQALKSLCWRCKGIQVEEVSLIGVDSLGLDLRVCSGTQIQTLRFPFNSRATSEYSAERQLNDLLFPRSNQKLHKIR